MIYLFYFASFLFTPIQQLFDVGSIVLVTFNFMIVTYGYITYFKTGNTVSEAIQASMLATLTFQLCCMFSHIDLITSVNHPLYAFIVISFFGVLLSLKKSTNFGTIAASMASITGLTAIIISLPGNTLDAVLRFS